MSVFKTETDPIEADASAGLCVISQRLLFTKTVTSLSVPVSEHAQSY